MTHSFTDPRFLYLAPYAWPRARDDEPLTQPVLALTEQTAQQEKTGDKAKSVSMKSALMRKCRALGGAKEWPDPVSGRQKKLRGGSWHLQDEEGCARESGSMFQAEGTAPAKRRRASGNSAGKAARVLWVLCYSANLMLLFNVILLI